MKKKLVIVTTHFGTNFSGGSTATCEIFQPMESEFDGVHVIGTELGAHDFGNLNFLKYNNWYQLRSIVKKFDTESTIFYGDFYNSIVLAILKIPFYFTYHDNWPELERFGFKNRLQSVLYTSAYIQIFQRALKVFTVSDFKLNFVRRYANQSILIRNGFKHHNKSSKQKNIDVKILMVGNIDSRKYKLAIPLLSKISRHSELKVDVFGNVVDRSIANKLQSYSFVNLQGYSNEIPFKDYTLLLHTSAMENLPMVVCEAIENQIPVIAFDVGGISEVINTQNGVLIDPYDLKSMTEKVLDVVNNRIGFTFNDNSILKEYSWKEASRKYKNQILG